MISHFDGNKIIFMEKKTPCYSVVTVQGECCFLLKSFGGIYLLSPRVLSVMLSSITYF